MTYSLNDFLDDLCSNKLTPDRQILDYLCPVNRIRLTSLLNRLSAVRSIKSADVGSARRKFNKKNTGRTFAHHSVKSVQGVQSKLVGSILERIITELFRSCKITSAITNIRTTTAEIDILIGLGPSALIMPMLRNAGTHALGEAKCYSSGFKQQWVTELAGLMDQHNCSLALIFVASPSKILPVGHRVGMHLLSAHKKSIVPFGLKQLNEVAQGANFLEILGTQHIQVLTGSTSLAI